VTATFLPPVAVNVTGPLQTALAEPSSQAIVSVRTDPAVDRETITARSGKAAADEPAAIAALALTPSTTPATASR
jgi:hypothetical protein